MGSMRSELGSGAPLYLHLSRRESQIMDAVFHLGEASVADVVGRIADRPGYNTIRNTMTTLERKGYLTHRQEGQRYLYAPADPPDEARRAAVLHLVDTFFDGSVADAVEAMLRHPELEVGEVERRRIARAVRTARGSNRVPPSD